MSRILVTGGTGFVGRHLCARLLEQGHEVHCVDPVVPRTGGLHPRRWPLFQPLDYAGFTYFAQDCREFFTECRASYDLVFHLAAMVGGRAMIENDPLAVAADLSIDAEFWRWAARTRPRKSVFFSSSAAYPIALQRREGHRLLREDLIEFDAHLGMPDMTYGWAKLTGEYLARLAYEKYGLRSVVYRPFSGYGEDQDLTYPFPAICRRVLENRGAPRISVWGTGDQMRDFIHIDDCVTGILETMERIDDAGALNLSTGILTSFKQFARMAAELAGYRPEVTGTSNTPEGVFARGGDTTKQAQYGFRPAVPFEEGIQRALAYFERQGVAQAAAQ